jgi:hypothetical protein
MRLRQREIDIEIYETRISAQSKQRHNDNMATIKKTVSLLRIWCDDLSS